MTVAVLGDNTTDDFAGTVDASHDNANPTTNYNTNFARLSNVPIDIIALFIKFTAISDLPAGATITDASLYLYGLGDAGGTVNVDVDTRRVLRNWVEGELTWNVYSTGNSWGTAGATNVTDVSSTLTDTISMDFDTSLGSRYEVFATGAQLVADIQDMLDNPSTNYGWKILPQNTSYQSYYVYSRSHTDGQRPYLEVTYTEGGGGGTIVNKQILIGVG